VEKGEWQKRGEGHRGRLRDRFLENGINSFTDAEIIELLLTFGTPRSDCKQTAKELLNVFGSLPGVLDASPAQLQRVKGVGPKNSFALQYVQAVASRYLQTRLKGRRYIHSSNDVRDYLMHTMRGLQKEVFTVIFLDSSHGIIDSEIVSEGTINLNTVYPRELVKRALEYNAAALVVAHNHPSGSIQPSAPDQSLTKNLHMACRFMQIRLLDHLIIGDGIYSFADSGLMAEINEQCDALIGRN